MKAAALSGMSRFYLLIVLCLAAADARGQTPVSFQDRPPLGAEITVDPLGNLPTSANIFALLDTVVPDVIADRIDAMVAVAENACAAPDPWLAFVSYLEYAAQTMADDVGLRQLMMFATYGHDQVAYARQKMRPVVSKLVRRAQQAGQLREDFSATDVPLIAFMLASAAEYAGPVEPELWRRYLALIIDALRPARDCASPLPARALTPRQMEQAIRAHGKQSQARR